MFVNKMFHQCNEMLLFAVGAKLTHNYHWLQGIGVQKTCTPKSTVLVDSFCWHKESACKSMHAKEYETSLYFQLKYAKITQYEQQRYLELMKKN